jgi:hypothetical protein
MLDPVLPVQRRFETPRFRWLKHFETHSYQTVSGRRVMVGVSDDPIHA